MNKCAFEFDRKDCKKSFLKLSKNKKVTTFLWSFTIMQCSKIINKKMS